jgi:hypothetical protein
MYLSPDGKILYTGGKAPSGFMKTIIRDILIFLKPIIDFADNNYE